MTLDVNWSSRSNGGPKYNDGGWSGFMNTYNVGGNGGAFQKTYSWTITFQNYGKQRFDTAVDDYGSVYINGVYQFDMGGYGGQTSRTTPGYFSPGTYTITATSFNSGGGPWGIALKWTGYVLPPPPTASFVTNNSEITAGQTSTLAWSTSGATSVSINQGVGAVGASGGVTVSPTVTTTYTLTASNQGGTVTKNVTVTVYPKPVIDAFTISSTNILQGNTLTAQWQTTGATTVVLSGSSGAFPSNQFPPPSVLVDGSYSWTAGVGGSYTLKLTAYNPLNFKVEQILPFTIRDETPNAFEWEDKTEISLFQRLNQESETITINGFGPTQYPLSELPIKSNYPIEVMVNGDGIWRNVEEI